MSNQVNPTGSLVAGVLQALQVTAKPPSASPEKSSAMKAAEVQAKTPGQRSIEASNGSLDAAIRKIQDYFKSSQSDLEFSVDKDTGSVVFKIVNASTREVVRQVPAEEVLAMARKLRQISQDTDAQGVLMDEKG